MEKWETIKHEEFEKALKENVPENILRELLPGILQPETTGLNEAEAKRQ